MPARTLPERKAKSRKRGENGLFHSLYASPKVRLREELQRKKREAAKIAKAEKAKQKPKYAKGQKKPSKPTYVNMIRRALIALNQRNGSSLFSIYKYIEEHYPVSQSYRKYIAAALKKGEEEGLFERERMSYRITSKGRRPRKKRAKKAAKKKSSTKRKRSSSPGKKSSSAKDKKKSSSSSSSSSSKKKKAKKSSEKKKKDKKKSASKAKAAKSKDAAASKSSRSRATKAKKGGAKAEDQGSSAGKKKSGGTTPAGYKFKWQYQEGDQWKDYDINASDVVEAAYQGYIKNPGMCDVRAVKSGQWQYQVDFLNNKQTNIQHENHKVRSIRRVPF